jgi:hypothetical protein
MVYERTIKKPFSEIEIKWERWERFFWFSHYIYIIYIDNSKKLFIL